MGWVRGVQWQGGYERRYSEWAAVQVPIMKLTKLMAKADKGTVNCRQAHLSHPFMSPHTLVFRT